MIDRTICLLTLLLPAGCAAPPHRSHRKPTGDLLTPASPEQLAQWSGTGLQAARSYWERMGSTAVVILHRGAVVAEWGAASRPVQSHSLRKSFLGALFGIAVEHGEIELDDTLEALAINDAVPPSLSHAEQQATVQHLLQSRSGVYHPAAWETPSMAADRPERGSHPPGTHWFYNNWDFNALGTVFNQETGGDLFRAFRDHIAQPIGMEHFDLGHTAYAYDDELSEHPAYSFELSTRDRARFGLLYLRNGDWDDAQLIPQWWIEQSRRAWSDAGAGVGYGYLWWVAIDGWHLGSRFAGAPYSARGWGGQYIVVVPEYDLVVAHTADLRAQDDINETTTFQDLFALILEAAPD